MHMTSWICCAPWSFPDFCDLVAWLGQCPRLVVFGALLRMPVLRWGLVMEKPASWHTWITYETYINRYIWPYIVKVNCAINKCNLLYAFSMIFFSLLYMRIGPFFISLCKMSSSILDLRDACVEANKEEFGSERLSRICQIKLAFVLCHFRTLQYYNNKSWNHMTVIQSIFLW